MERAKRDQQYSEMRKNSLDLQSLLQNVKSEVLDKLKESREEYLAIFNQSEEER